MKALIHASEILTAQGIKKKDGRRVTDSDLSLIRDGSIVYDDKVIEWVGETKNLPSKYKNIEKEDLHGLQAVIPGLIDCHTHMIFAGDRSSEFALRCAGMSYEEIAKKGGGILTTVKETRNASLEELINLGVGRVQESLRFGVRAIEIKSGYGLDLESEIKSLRAIQALKEKFSKIYIHSTFLGAHAIPSGLTREDYVKQVIEEMLPLVYEEKLAESCDVFVDQGFFTIDDARKILSKAMDFGMKVRIHADELTNSESTQLGVELGAASVDHLLKVSEASIQKLSRSDTVAVLLPGTAFYLKENYAPARKLIDSGAVVAIATDFNPGSCMCNSLPAIMTLSALYMGMSRSEVFAAVTYNASKALGLEKRKGFIDVGADSDFLVLPFKKCEELYYRFAWAPA